MWDVTQRHIFPWLYVKSIKCLWFSPDVHKVPHHLNRVRGQPSTFSLEFSYTWVQKAMHKLSLLSSLYCLCCISLPVACPLVLKAAIVHANFLQKVKANPAALPCLHCRKIYCWISLRWMFSDWYVPNQKRTLWNKEKSSPIPTAL